jgi:SPASM domain peptide maturase of grasp-with-spasm system
MMTQSKDTFLLLFSFCKVVSGEEKSIICDFQKEKIKFIPNEMVAVIKMLQEEPFNSVKKQFTEDDADIFDSYVKFLSDEGFVFYNESKEEFVDIQNYWTSPEIINNAIIEYGFNNYNLKDVLIQLDNLFTKFIELRFTVFTEENITELIDVLEYCSSSVLRSLRIYIPDISKSLSQKLIELIKPFAVVDCIIFYNSKFNKLILKDDQQIYFITKTLKDITKANVDRKFLVNNIEFFYECQNYNPYYNKKVAINSKGEIKNCIKNKAVFGNLKDHSITEVVMTNQFQKFWHITHNQIVDIQNSELRYNYIITNDLEKINDRKFKIIL